MTTTLTETDATALREAEEIIASTALPVPAVEAAAEVEAAAAELDVTSSNSIIAFGTKAQERVTAVSETMLVGVRNKDIGPAQNALNDVVVTIRGLDLGPLKGGKEPGWFGRLLGQVKPVVKFLQQYETVESQIETITASLDGHSRKLMTDIESLDRLYGETLSYFRALDVYIEAGERVRDRLAAEDLPALKAKAEASGDMADAQATSDMQARIDELERRVHDLRLTRQIVLQSLPAIRNTQEVDKSLVNKIKSVIANTIPMWKNQMALALTANNTLQAARAVNDVTDLTNDMLESTSGMLREANASSRKAVERGIADIESIEKANANLLAMVDDSLRIVEEGRARRWDAEKRLIDCEAAVRVKLLEASKAA